MSRVSQRRIPDVQFLLRLGIVGDGRPGVAAVVAAAENHAHSLLIDAAARLRGSVAARMCAAPSAASPNPTSSLRAAGIGLATRQCTRRP